MPPDNAQNPMLGIDLGTTFSSIARWDGRGPEVYETTTGGMDLQSVVYYDPEKKEFLVGKLAFRRGMVHPENMALGVKRCMDNAALRIKVGGCEFSPIELSAKILSRLYGGVVEKFPRGKFRSRGTVVTVPYYFKAHQCENTRKAAEMADIECIGLLQEPISASLSYAWKYAKDHPDTEDEENIVVFDLGGGTFDLTLFRLQQTKDKMLFEVLATDGNDRIGGMDFDECLAKWLLAKGGLSLDGLPDLDKRRAWQKVLEQATETKIGLGQETETTVSVANVVADRHIEVDVARTDFERCIKPYRDKVQLIVERLMSNAGLGPDKVSRVIRVGGSSKIPCMKTLLIDYFGEDRLYGDINPLTCVAEGAALYAAYVDDPAVLGRDIEITTRTCHALGVEAQGGRFQRLILSNRKAPCEFTQMFTNTADDMESLDINVYQGGSDHVKDNALIGTVHVPGLPKRPKETLDIAVTFRVSAAQLLAVKVVVKGDSFPVVEREAPFKLA